MHLKLAVFHCISNHDSCVHKVKSVGSELPWLFCIADFELNLQLAPSLFGPRVAVPEDWAEHSSVGLDLGLFR